MPKRLPKKVKMLTSSLFSTCQLRDHARQAHIHLVQAQRHSKETNATWGSGVWGPTPLEDRRWAPTPLLRQGLVAGQTPDDAFRQKMQFSGLPGPENVKNNENHMQTIMKMHETT